MSELPARSRAGSHRTGRLRRTEDSAARARGRLEVPAAGRPHHARRLSMSRRTCAASARVLFVGGQGFGLDTKRGPGTLASRGDQGRSHCGRHRRSVASQSCQSPSRVLIGTEGDRVSHVWSVTQNVRREDSRFAAVMIRRATDQDWLHIWPFFSQIVAAGETYAYPEDLDRQTGRALWMEEPPGETVVALEGDTVLGSAKMGPNRPGRGAHVSTASFMVDPAHTCLLYTSPSPRDG